MSPMKSGFVPAGVEVIVIEGLELVSIEGWEITRDQLPVESINCRNSSNGPSMTNVWTFARGSNITPSHG